MKFKSKWGEDICKYTWFFPFSQFFKFNTNTEFNLKCKEISMLVYSAMVSKYAEVFIESIFWGQVVAASRQALIRRQRENIHRPGVGVWNLKSSPLVTHFPNKATTTNPSNPFKHCQSLVTIHSNTWTYRGHSNQNTTVLFKALRSYSFGYGFYFFRYFAFEDQVSLWSPGRPQAYRNPFT